MRLKKHSQLLDDEVFLAGLECVDQLEDVGVAHSATREVFFF